MGIDIYAVECFCDRWMQKADQCRTDELAGLFDRFYTLYVVFNRIYSTSAFFYRNRGGEAWRMRFSGDRTEATEVMANAIGQKRFSSALSDRNDARAACYSIHQLLLERRFFLHSKRNSPEPDYDRDLRLAQRLRKEELKAVLECLYQIRCNIFHGQKEFVERQADLLNPAIVLLSLTIKLSRVAMRELHEMRPEEDLPGEWRL